MQEISPHILSEAADWLMQLSESDVSQAHIAACEQWQKTSPEHARAWHLAESLLGKLDAIPAPLAMPALRQAEQAKRDTTARLALLLAIVPIGWLTWRFVPKPDVYYTWTAAYRTATGDRQHLRLADGTQVHMNTATAIDVVFDAQQRRIQLRSGEILITTAKDTHPTRRPFYVDTAQGQLEALGTRFSVRQEDGYTHLGVFEGAVRVTPKDPTYTAVVIHAGEQVTFTSTAIDTPTHADDSTIAWKDGMLLVDDMRLVDVVKALGRYRTGMLHCLPEIADLRISGAFPVDNIDQALRMLSTTYPVDMTSRFRGYWITLIPRSPQHS